MPLSCEMVIKILYDMIMTSKNESNLNIKINVVVGNIDSLNLFLKLGVGPYRALDQSVLDSTTFK